MTTLAIFFVLSLAASLLLTPVCRVAAHRLGFIAPPKEDRWHKRPTALFGGVAIVTTVLLAGVVMRPSQELWPVLAGGFAIAAFGFVDDVMSLKASTKLIAQITVAALLLFFGYRLQWTESMVGDAMLTLFWIVGITNAFNLLDNMDGLCAGTALIAGTFLLIGFVTGGAAASAPALYLAALLGATAGFLVYNFHPASIFMGDTGSLFLGLNIAALTLTAKPETMGRSGLLSVVAAPVLPLLIPIFDTTLVTALRLLSGRRPSQGGRDHMSHRLVAVGLSERRAVATLWMLAAAGGLVSVMLQRREAGWGMVAALTFVLAMIIFAVYLARIRVYEEGNLAALQGEAFTPLVANFMYKRRVAEVLLDLCLIPLAYYTAYRLRFEGPLLAENYKYFIQSLPVVLAAQLLALFVAGGYRGTWRYFGMMDAVVFSKGVILGSAAAEIVIVYLYRFENYSRSVFVIDAALLVLLLSATRASFRLIGEFALRRMASGRRCIIYGTGGASMATIREAFGADAPLKIVGYVDDDARQWSSRVAGYSVIGGYRELLDRLERDEVDAVVLNAHLMDAGRLRQLEAACRDRGVDLLELDVRLTPFSTASVA
jgi:UDP-GlcNAc:undecaprenyl-phosphate/decaprenyl-phosphate GlcNAc-1-phosphate transferase